MANKSQFRIEFKSDDEVLGFEVEYYNWVDKPDNKVIAKCKNKNGDMVVVNEKILERLEYDSREKKVEEVKLNKAWVDCEGNVYKKDDVYFYDYEGKQITENIKTEVFEAKEFIALIEFLDNYASEAYYYVKPVDAEKNIKEINKLKDMLSGSYVAVNKFNLTSKGFTRSLGGLRLLNDGNFELMIAKNQKGVK